MTTHTQITTANRGHVDAALHTARSLLACYLGLSLVTLGAIIVLRGDSSIVNPAVWIRASVVVVSAALMMLFVSRAVAGHRRAYLRLRLVSALMLVAIVVIIALPGTFPVWLKLEQGVCGLLLLGVVVQINSRRVRSSFAAR